MQNPNPYAAPSAPVADVMQANGDGNFIAGGRPVPSGNGWQWIVSGWELFKLNPGVWIANVLILFVVLIVLSVIPLLGQLAAQLLLPVFVGGLMLGCYALTHGEPYEVGHLFAGFREKFGPLLLLGVFYVVASLAIFFVVAMVFGMGFLATAVSMKPSGSIMTVLLMVLVTMALGIPLAMAIWFAPALVVMQNIAPLDAMKQSFQACLKNIVPFLVYGIVSFVISILAAIPFLLGYLVWGPVIVASVYAGYRDIFLETT
jgi:uncharacterized membrane protein